MSEEQQEGQQAELFDVGAAIDGIAGEMGLGDEKKTPEGEEKAPAEGSPTQEAPASQEAPAATPGSTPAAPAPGTQPAAGTEAPAGSPPPDTWTAAGKAAWSTLPPAVQAEVIKREGDMARGLEDYGKRAKVGDFFAEQVSPFAEMYAKNGLQVGRLIGPLLNAYATITWGDPQQKAVMLRAMAQDAGVDLGKIASGEVGTVDPQVARLQQEIVNLRQGVQQSLGAIQQTRLAETSKSVDSFASDTAKHPYFWEVVDDMNRLVKSGVVVGLEDAYDMAVMNNPLTRAKEVDRLASEKADKLAKEAAEKAKQVKRATAANVRSSEQGGAAPDKLGTIDDTLKETLASIRARE